MKVCKCTFVGKGIFPLDMLRYDRCWPATTEDVMKIAYCEDPMLNKESYEITVCTYNYTSPSLFTYDRWISFGWKPLFGNEDKPTKKKK